MKNDRLGNTCTFKNLLLAKCDRWAYINSFELVHMHYNEDVKVTLTSLCLSVRLYDNSERPHQPITAKLGPGILTVSFPTTKEKNNIGKDFINSVLIGFNKSNSFNYLSIGRILLFTMFLILMLVYMLLRLFDLLNKVRRKA